MSTFIKVINSNMPNEIITKIRNILFEIKTKHGMIPYSSLREFLLNNTNIYDIYANEAKDLTKIYLYNIEHVVLASIISRRPGKEKEDKIYINNEPYHDPHILFPTLKAINSLRSNYIFGDIEEKGFKIEKIIDKVTIETIKKNNYKEKDNLHIEPLPVPADFQINDSIIIDDKCNKEINESSGKKYYKCELGECIFEPKMTQPGQLQELFFIIF